MIWRVILLCLLIANQALAVRLPSEHDAFTGATIAYQYDDSSGELFWWESTDSAEPYPTGAPFLDLTGTTNTTISNLRIAYADQGVATPAGEQLNVWDCQFVTNTSAVLNLAGGADSFHNVLFSGCGAAVVAGTNAFTIGAEQVTARVANFWTSTVAPAFVGLTNSIILGQIGSVNAAVNVAHNPPLADFQVNGAGNYYLSPTSPLRHAFRCQSSLLTFCP